MTERLDIDLEHINQSIADRSDVFYWQTDRAVDPATAGQIWADRHRYFTDDELVVRVNEALGDNRLQTVEPLDPEAQTNLGNVNSVRTGVLESGQEVIIRSHPKGIVNGYFHAEAEAARRANEAGLPSYQTLAIHDYEGGDDFAFQVIDKLRGSAVQKWLEAHSNDEPQLLRAMGAMMARVHQVQIDDGFGPFDNERAKQGELVGLHGTFAEAVRAGLDFNLSVLEHEGILTSGQVAAADKLFSLDNPLLRADKPVLVHNDFADWNVLTDGESITGVLDWDECVGGTAVSDIACWSTFFEPERLSNFLDGYWSVADKPADFEATFELLRLRYTLSKMTLRIRRYSWEPSDVIRQRIENGKAHLAASFDYFNL